MQRQVQSCGTKARLPKVRELRCPEKTSSKSAWNAALQKLRDARTRNYSRRVAHMGQRNFSRRDCSRGEWAFSALRMTHLYAIDFVRLSNRFRAPMSFYEFHNLSRACALLLAFRIRFRPMPSRLITNRRGTCAIWRQSGPSCASGGGWYVMRMDAAPSSASCRTPVAWNFPCGDCTPRSRRRDFPRWIGRRASAGRCGRE